MTTPKRNRVANCHFRAERKHRSLRTYHMPFPDARQFHISFMFSPTTSLARRFPFAICISRQSSMSVTAVYVLTSLELSYVNLFRLGTGPLPITRQFDNCRSNYSMQTSFRAAHLFDGMLEGGNASTSGIAYGGFHP